jgi:hypothetical protein
MVTPTTSPTMKKTLGLTGVTVNAMALIAPGAFLWMTYQLQAANTDVTGKSTALDMWTGIVVALIVAFLTAFAFAELARRYPNAGSGSAYYFAEKAFLDHENPNHRRFARIAKFITGWAAHLFYWVYPGVMVAFFAVLLTYIAGQFGLAIPIWGQILTACAFSALVGLIAMRGITGSTTASIAINIIQLTALVVFSVLAILFRLKNPLGVTLSGWYHPTGISIVMPHNLTGMLFQSTIAMLILVGFESSTALSAEAKNPRRDIPRGVILSLAIQGLFAYLLEYFAANYALSDRLVSADGTLKGISAAAASGAPIGDLAIQIGNAFLGGNGHRLYGRHRHPGNHSCRHEHGCADQFRHGPRLRNAGCHGFAARKICHPLCGRDRDGDRFGPDRYRRCAGWGHDPHWNYPGLQLGHIRPLCADLRSHHCGLRWEQGFQFVQAWPDPGAWRNRQHRHGAGHFSHRHPLWWHFCESHLPGLGSLFWVAYLEHGLLCCDQPSQRERDPACRDDGIVGA